MAAPDLDGSSGMERTSRTPRKVKAASVSFQSRRTGRHLGAGILSDAGGGNSFTKRILILAKEPLPWPARSDRLSDGEGDATHLVSVRISIFGHRLRFRGGTD
jgi:hypothetical protein